LIPAKHQDGSRSTPLGEFDADRPCDMALRWGLGAPQLEGISLISTMEIVADS